MSIEKIFNDNSYKLLNSFPNYTNETNELIRNMKETIYPVENGIIIPQYDKTYVKNFIRRLATKYLRLFTEKQLIDSFNLPKSYYRQIKIYSNLPTTINKNYKTYLLELFNFPNDNFYDMCFSLFQLSGVDEITIKDLNKLIDKCKRFEEENPFITAGSKSEYLDIDQEISNIIAVRDEIKENYINNTTIYNDIVRKYAESINSNDYEFAEHDYINKKIGNLGEYYVYNYLTNYDYSVFVSKDLKNGFGYDLYYLDNGIETLVEVKATTKKLGNINENFILSNSELKVMKDCLTKDNAKYIIARVKLTDDYKLNKIILLDSNDGITFNSSNTEGYCYRFSELSKQGEATYNRTSQKIRL